MDRLFARLARRTATTRYIPEIDGVRFLSISMVVGFHVLIAWRLAEGDIAGVIEPFGAAPPVPRAAGLPTQLLVAGKYGVEIFFAVSGFILALPFLSHRLGRGSAVDVRRYYWRRLTRLEPPYLIALSLWAIVAMTASVGDGVAADGALWSRYLAGTVYAHGLLFDQANPILGVAWSLEVEVQFYLLVPTLASVLTRTTTHVVRRELIVVVGMAGPVVASILPVGQGPYLFLWFTPFFLAGWLLADVYVVNWGGRPSPSSLWDLAALGGLLGALALFAYGQSAILFLGPLPVWFLLAGALRGRLTRRLLSNRWLATIGGAAYSIYLLHYPILLIWSRGLRPGSMGFIEAAASIVVILGTVLLAGLFFFATIERPCMDPRWPQRLGALFWRPARHAKTHPVRTEPGP